MRKMDFAAVSPDFISHKPFNKYTVKWKINRSEKSLR